MSVKLMKDIQLSRCSIAQTDDNPAPPRQAVKPTSPPAEPPKPRNPPPPAGPPPPSNRMNPFQHELKSRVNTSDDSLPSPRSLVEPRGQEVRRQPVSLSQYSSDDEVREWLNMKGFSGRSMDLLQGYAGVDLFNFDRQELETLLGREEGRRLDSLLNVQKSNSGFRTRGASELKAILQRRKERADDPGYTDDRGLGSRPSFMPETPPDYSPDGSIASSEDFGDAGKTLRYLLERQRKKISRKNFQ